MRKKPVSNYKKLFLGYFCLFFGITSGILPVIQGWFFLILGFLLLKDDAPWAKRLLKWAPKRFPRAAPFFKKTEKKVDIWLERLGLSNKTPS